MNSKLIAVFAVIVMALSGVTLVSSATDGADTDVPLGTIYADNGEGAASETVALKFNESAYTGYDSYTFTLKAADSKDSITVDTDSFYSFTKDESPTSSEKTVKNITISATAGSGVGNYNLTVNATNATEGSYTIYIELKVSVTENTDTENTLTIALDPIYYTLTVNVTDDQNVTFNDVTINADTIYSSSSTDNTLTVETPTSGVIVSDYDSWYAVNLPKGLKIAYEEGNLRILGMTNTVDTVGKTINVVGRDSATGAEVFGSFTLKVNEAPEINYVLTSGDTNLQHSGDVWIAAAGDEVTLKITGVTSANVSVVKSDEFVRESLTNGVPKDDSISFELPVSSGVGVYYIEMDVGSSVTVATLNIIVSSTGAGAGFIVVGGA